MPTVSWLIITPLYIAAIVAAGFYGINGAGNVVNAWVGFIFVASLFSGSDEVLNKIAKTYREKKKRFTPQWLDATSDMIIAGLFAWLGWFWLFAASVWTCMAGIHVREKVKKINEEFECPEQSSGKDLPE